MFFICLSILLKPITRSSVMRLINLRAIVKYFSLGIIISSILHLSVAAEVEQPEANQPPSSYDWLQSVLHL
jgi:hypothetical protein